MRFKPIGTKSRPDSALAATSQPPEAAAVTVSASPAVATPAAATVAGAAATAVAIASAALLLGAPAAAQSVDCDRECLIEIADRYVAALPNKDWQSLPWAERVRHTENDVALMIGDGLWGTVTHVDETPFKLADPDTGNVLWLGIVEEHGDAAYLGLRLKVEDRRIADVEAVVTREGTPARFAPTDGYELDATFLERMPPSQRRPRALLIALAEGYYDTMQLNDGDLLGRFAPDCARISNGVNLTHGEDVPAEGCKAQFEIGYYKPVDRVRARRYPIVDEERGIVVALALLDRAARYTEYSTTDGQKLSIPVEYPNSLRVLELLKIRNGEVERVEGLAVFQPYLMPSRW